MTIIYNYNKKNKSRYVILNSTKRRFSWKRKMRYFFSGAGKQLGHISIIVFALMPFFTLGICWIILFGQNISLDYKIYNLKQELSKIEDEINELQEKSMEIISFETTEKWAESNGFIKVKNISYLDLTNESLAQR